MMVIPTLNLSCSCAHSHHSPSYLKPSHCSTTQTNREPLFAKPSSYLATSTSCKTLVSGVSLSLWRCESNHGWRFWIPPRQCFLLRLVALFLTSLLARFDSLIQNSFLQLLSLHLIHFLSLTHILELDPFFKELPLFLRSISLCIFTLFVNNSILFSCMCFSDTFSLLSLHIWFSSISNDMCFFFQNSVIYFLLNLFFVLVLCWSFGGRMICCSLLSLF